MAMHSNLGSHGAAPPAGTAARRIILAGRVQGVGFRPAVARLAVELGLAGCVRNTLVGVTIEIEGSTSQVRRFLRDLVGRLPGAAELTDESSEPLIPQGRRGFTIEPSSNQGPLRVRVPTDVAVCGDCLAEVVSPANRRFAYPFTSCTACGPRYSVLADMPYDRAATSMAKFDFCSRCRHEYETPSERRFHAQTNACSSCGPRAWTADRSGRRDAQQQAAIDKAVCAISAGAVVALRGMGGYQLIVDATNEDAVARLRRRKCRPAKPLAVLVQSLSAAERLGMLGEAERQELTAPANAIVVVSARDQLPLGPGDRGGERPAPLAASVSGGLNSVGLMLPTTALHWQIAEACNRPLVATSGNRDGEPLAVEIDESRQSLCELADLWLHHDRDIVRPVDDSVVRVIAGQPVTLRLGRGMAPLPLELSCTRPMLALGGQQKAAVALSNGTQAILGPHLGDMDSVAARGRFTAHVRQLIDLYGSEPDLLVHDLHPGYFTTRYAADQGLPTIAVQHHHAHIAAGMLEQGWLDRTVLGVAFDGTGFGADGVIWGGEFLLATVRDFRRVGCLRPFRLPGGEAAIREPWRIAALLVADTLSPDVALELFGTSIGKSSVQNILTIAGNDGLSPCTTSAGRLFDAVASLVLGVDYAQFEGQPAMLLESASDLSAAGTYSLPAIETGETIELDWRPLVATIMADRVAGVAPGAIAMRFHRAVAAAIQTISRFFPTLPLVLGGGVFQNRVLVELLAELASSGQALGLPGVIPPNDGGLAAGQLAVAMAHLTKERTPLCV